MNRELPFTRAVRDIIRSIPRGKVVSYGQIAALAGDARQARQVAWILHSSSEKNGLPWHRVIGSRGRISLPPGRGGREQRRLLLDEGVRFRVGGTIEWRVYGWTPRLAKISRLEAIDLTRLLD
jgi:methylated-DNA-protein-cysteine methyltransferase related protein